MYQFIGIRTIVKRIKAIKFMMKDKAVPKRKKALVIFGVAYLLMPIDLIPIAILPIAFLDDLALWGCILYYLKDTLDTYWLGEKEVDYSKKFNKEKIIDNVEFTVVENEKEK